MRSPALPPLGGAERLQDRVRRELRAAIVEGRLVPGELYSVPNLADGFGVSRSPVREALLDLARQGMVRFEKNRGVRILETSAHDLEEIFSLRLLLEVPATRRAVAQLVPETIQALDAALADMLAAAEADDERAMMRHDARFHDLILRQSGNRRLADFVDRLRDLVLTRGSSTAGRSRTLHDIVDEHRTILLRIRAGDADGAAEAMRAHLSHTQALLLEQEVADRRGAG